MARVGFGRTFTKDHSINSRLWHLLVNVLGGSGFVTDRQRLEIYRRCGIEVGAVEIQNGCTFFSENIEIEDGVHLGDRIYFDNRDRITVRSGAAISSQCSLLTSGHDVGGPDCRAGMYRSAPILVEEGAWICCGATILAGVTVGRGAVVAAGAVVTKDCPPHSFVGGVPAKVLRQLSD